MKKCCIIAILSCVSLLLIAGVGKSDYQQKQIPEQCPLNELFFNPPSPEFGYIPHPVDLSHLQPRLVTAAPLPTFWDWRLHNGVTSVKDQSTCGSCWAFAAAADLESTVRVRSGDIYDFSEENIKECNHTGRDCGGGNAWAATNYFTRQGAALESCDPYHAYDTGICNTSCEKVKQVTGWRLLADDVNMIKSAVYQYGPCYTTFYASFSGFSSYDGSYVLYHTGIEAPNHAVLIVGWDDSLAHAGGTGAWIVKNSWGTGWGDSGFFYIAYDSARIGENSCFYSAFKHYDTLEMSGTLYHYDEGGWYDSWGFGSQTAWGLVKFTAHKDDCIKAVDFWAVDDDMQYQINIYDDFNGNAVSNLLYSQSGTCGEAGYYSVELDSPIWIAQGNDFVIAIEFTCSGYNWPVPCDHYAPLESGKCYLSSTGGPGTWIDMSGNYRDVAIRARTKNHEHVFEAHDFNGDNSSDVSLFRPENGTWYLRGVERVGYGRPGDIPVNGDYNGDSTTDVAVFRPSTAMWAIRGQTRHYYGMKGDIPVPGDYNGDGSCDVAVFRPSTALWAVMGQFKISFGRDGDIPVPGDYNGDGTTDIAVFRPSTGTWFVKDQFTVVYGLLGDIPVPGDYNGDGTTDIAVFRPSLGKWAVKDQSINYYGAPGDIPVPGDYNGDSVTDIVIFRPSTSMWAAMGQFRIFYGQEGDIPLVR